MRISGLVWFEDVVEKLSAKHRVQQHEVREVFDNRPHFYFVERGHRVGEDVYAALGRSDGGRYLAAFFVHKKDDRALILSARDMTRAERRRYEQT